MPVGIKKNGSQGNWWNWYKKTCNIMFYSRKLPLLERIYCWFLIVLGFAGGCCATAIALKDIVATEFMYPCYIQSYDNTTLEMGSHWYCFILLLKNALIISTYIVYIYLFPSSKWQNAVSVNSNCTKGTIKSIIMLSGIDTELAVFFLPDAALVIIFINIIFLVNISVISKVGVSLSRFQSFCDPSTFLNIAGRANTNLAAYPIAIGATVSICPASEWVKIFKLMVPLVSPMILSNLKAFILQSSLVVRSSSWKPMSLLPTLNTWARPRASGLGHFLGLVG